MPPTVMKSVYPSDGPTVDLNAWSSSQLEHSPPKKRQKISVKEE